ncbi:hypothetical protein MAR_003226 [Mya arenaria]|uniref:Uncharacterized protein n=1 Tax=Mya arenaria TaxID=6604 RepID=A0ABY7G5E3_MYAAR|nr:hypothetical protein MAR_003226 [Mya arenaria]
MELRPSEIYYSQDSINNVFDKRCRHSYKLIGETLDEICEESSNSLENATLYLRTSLITFQLRR